MLQCGLLWVRYRGFGHPISKIEKKWIAAGISVADESDGRDYSRLVGWMELMNGCRASGWFGMLLLLAADTLPQLLYVGF